MIAISYRREDSTPVAGRLHDRLQADFGKGNVFMDFDSIPYGVDFREQIRQTLKRAKVVIAVIGPTWFGAGRGKGNRRIDDPADFVRLEIAIALQRGIPIIPVLVGDTPMPQVDNLPEDLRGLAFRNALILDTGVDFHHHADRLIAGIKELMNDPLNADTISFAVKPAPKKEGPKTQSSVVDPDRRKELIGGSVVIAVLIAIAGWYFFGKSSRPKNPPALPLTIATPAPAPILAETPVITPTAAATAIAALTPAPTPFVAIIPVPVPIPTPALLPPTPSENGITDDEVHAFVAAHYQATERKDLDYLLSQYDDLVDYNTDGRRDRAFIRNGYVNYFKRWPVASFSLGPVQVMRSPRQNTVTAYFEIRYSVRDVGSNRSRQGRADEVWMISKPFGALKIISEKETVHGEAPERRRH